MPRTSVACASKSSAMCFAGRSGFERPAETAAELVVATASVVITLVVIALAVVLFVSLRKREGRTREGHLQLDVVAGGKSRKLRSRRHDRSEERRGGKGWSSRGL